MRGHAGVDCGAVSPICNSQSLPSSSGPPYVHLIQVARRFSLSVGIRPAVGGGSTGEGGRERCTRSAPKAVPPGPNP